MPFDTQTGRLAGKLGALALHATHDSHELTAPARAAYRDRFLAQTDPALPHAERLKRADCLMRLHMARLALKSAQARRKRAAAAKPWRYADDAATDPTSEESTE